MATYLHVFIFSLIGGIVSLIGGFLLLAHKKRAAKLVTYATPFAAGALLATAFLDLLPEAAHEGNIERALLGTLGGILLFFLLERFLRWFHHHHDEEDANHEDANANLIVIGDTIHNFIDGIAIAAGFLVSVPTGVLVTLAVAAHEIPQEIGDFGLLLKKGFSPKKVLLVNILSAFATVASALLFFSLGTTALEYLDVVLGITAGFFIYIAVSDIIPDIHRAEDKTIAGPQTMLLVLGVVAVGIVTTTLHDYIDTHDHNEDQHSHQELHDDHDEEHDSHFELHDEDHHDEEHDEDHHDDEHTESTHQH